MTDKQIIIDGIDVSECENLMQGVVPFGCMEDRKTCSCINNPNCLYKQLKRKEQELQEKEDILLKIKHFIHYIHYAVLPLHRGITHSIADEVDFWISEIHKEIDKKENK